MGDLKFVVRTIDAPATRGGKALALCTEGGEIVGKQFRCHVANEATEIGTITVSFYIDGDTIRLADSDG
jgi:hypothetical protein